MKTDGGAVARRVYLIMAAIAGGGIAGAWMFWGMPGALGFTLGSVISFGNAWWTHRIAMSIGPAGENPGERIVRRGIPLSADAGDAVCYPGLF